MTVASLLLALLIALAYGALYHLMRGGGPGRFVLFLVLSVAGFTVGHLVGVWRGWSFLSLGALNLGMATLGSLTFMVVGEWLVRFDADKQSSV